MALLMTREGLIALTQSSVALLGLMPWNQWSLKAVLRHGKLRCVIMPE